MKLDVKFAGNSRTFSTGFSGTTFIHDGQNGATFTPAVSADGIISWTNDRELPNPEPVCIKGADGKDGAPGAKGDKGDKGDRGERGIQGIQGIPGAAGKDGAQGDRGPQGIQGPQGVAGPQGPAGKDGADGRTPVVGTDYFTAADKAEMVTAVIASLPVYGGETA